jgi:hypothetical protein
MHHHCPIVSKKIYKTLTSNIIFFFIPNQKKIRSASFSYFDLSQTEAPVRLKEKLVEHTKVPLKLDFFERNITSTLIKINSVKHFFNFLFLLKRNLFFLIF